MAEDCIFCPAGKYCQEGTVSPIDCVAGRYSGSPSATSQAACLQCPPAEEQLFAQLQVLIKRALPPSRRSRSHPPQDVPTEQLMQIRKQVQEEAQYFNESFQQLRMAQS